MDEQIPAHLPAAIRTSLSNQGITELRPCQLKALDRGLLSSASLLICTPTASGKTLVAEIAMMNAIENHAGKTVYIVPLKALANEKYREFSERYGNSCKIALSIGDSDSAEPYLQDFDIIICTAEKLDSLIRHDCPWLAQVKIVIVDEIHLINDPSRGPTLEILVTILRQVHPSIQIIGLSATIGNPEQLSQWLGAELILDDFRPTKLKKGVYLQGQVTFEDHQGYNVQDDKS